MKDETEHRYDDIINLPHPVSSAHPRMPMRERAAQFSPFAALTGHGEAIRETGRLTENEKELDEDSREILDRKLGMLEKMLMLDSGGIRITVTYFRRDAKKEGGAYVTASGIAKKIDRDQKCLILEGQEPVPLGSVAELDGEFSFLERGLAEDEIS